MERQHDHQVSTMFYLFIGLRDIFWLQGYDTLSLKYLEPARIISMLAFLRLLIKDY